MCYAISLAGEWCPTFESVLLSIQNIQQVYLQGLPEVLKHFCSTRVAILINRLRQTSRQTKTNGRKFCILMCGTLSVKSSALGDTKKEAREIKLSITLFSVFASILPITSGTGNFHVWDAMSGTYSQIHFPSSSIVKKCVVASVTLAGTEPYHVYR